MTHPSAVREFQLTFPQLLAVSRELGTRLEAGLLQDGTEVACFPTYIPQDGSQPSGDALVLDLGGTNFRAAHVRFEPGKAPSLCAGPAGAQLPIRRGEPLPLETFLEFQTKALEQVAPHDALLPLGYCFSYPAKAQLDGDAVLTRWTKGVDIPGVVGQGVGDLLRQHASQHGLDLPRVVVINDTVAALFAGLALGEADGYIGLIVGTGTNMASFFPAKAVPKLASNLVASFPSLPINLESGNFKPSHLNQFDDLLDRKSENPGFQRFEKAVSGAYLGRLFALACPEHPFDPESGAQGLVELLETTNCPPDVRLLAQAILDRSADYVAASLAGLCAYLNRFAPMNTVRILAEGSLFWKAPGFSGRVQATLQKLCTELGLPTRCHIAALPHANLFGTAVAALAATPR